MEPLRAANPPIIAPSRLEDFLSGVLLNIAEIREHSRLFLEALQVRQKESFVFRGIGRLIFSAAVEWGPAYTAYTIGFPMADWLFKEEKTRNPRFNDLLMVRFCNPSRDDGAALTSRRASTGLSKAPRSEQARLRHLPQSRNVPRAAIRPPARTDLQKRARGGPRPRVRAAGHVVDQAAGTRFE